MESIFKALFIITLSCSSFAGDLPNQAWFLKIRFTPKDTLLEGINIHEIDSTFIKASLLDDSLINKKDSGYFWPSENYKFTIDRDVNRDGNNEKIMVGVYKDKYGSSGRFILVLSKTADNNYKKADLVKMEGTASFHVLFIKDNYFVCWSDCMGCDYYCYLKYILKKYSWDCPAGKTAE
jgi:hypothetical protein